MEPVPPNMEEFVRLYNALMHHLSDEEECEEIACIIYFVRQKTVRPYDELDNLAASIAFSKLSSTD
jgi:hypothetical protein